jgi:UDP-N-acetylglucosamine diphosphorylase/glucosamine-1-phosphate N-acetyltransferase
MDLSNDNDNVAIIILAAGKGTRMKSSKAKVLHTVAGRPMILHVIDTAVDVAGKNVVVVIGNQAEAVRETVESRAQVLFAFQSEQLGTGHAVQCALPFIPESISAAIILCGDVPLIATATIRRLISQHFQNGNEITLLAVTLDNPYGYGRVIRDAHGNVDAIVEESDATAAEKAIDLINSGIYCVNRSFLETALLQVESRNAQQEIYLTDIIGIARRSGKKIGLMNLNDYESSEVIGINTMEDLRRVETVMGRSRKIS